MLCGLADERVDVGIAAHDAMHHDDVVGLDLRHDEVADAPLDAARDAALGDQLGRRVLVTARELDVRRSVGARGEQLQLDPADPAADVEDGCSAYVPGKPDQIARRAAKAVLPEARASRRAYLRLKSLR